MLAPVATRFAANGMVCTVDHLASAAGVAMLRAGGTAADAAVAANAVLAVTSPHLCGMGGDLFALVHHGDGPPACLVSTGRSGSGADPDRLRAEGATRMPFRGDMRSVPVPGCVDGWVALHERFGRLPLAEVLAPATALAEEGFPASPTLAMIAPFVADVPGAGEVSAATAPGALVRRPGSARVLRAIVEEGRAGFYEGEFGEGFLRLGAGEHTPEDLAEPNATWTAPLGLDVFGHRVWTAPPPSQGYLALAGAWIAEQLDLPDDPDDPRWAHLLVEAARHAAFDRPAVLHQHADGAALLDPRRLAPRATAIDPDRAATLPGRFAAGDTTYLCAVDDRRMGVSLIQSNAADFGAHVVEPGTGTFLQNRGIGFSLEPGHPAEYGPRRRPPHTLLPAVVTDTADRLVSVLGSMGGDSQPQIVLQLLARLLVAGADPATAVSAGRFTLRGEGGGFATWEAGGDVAVAVEGHAPEAWDAGLSQRGHRVVRGPAFDHGAGHAHAIVVDHDRGVLAGGTDPRPEIGSASGW